ncbi:MAG: hypothetical protein JXA71_06905 [Chitinispirillaceae bacterium]|nr:hypothetical protein [Chitinispirillaceae bacterium]
MTTIREIEAAVKRLPKRQFSRFRTWFEEFDAKQWDNQFEKDVQEGRINRLAEEALSDYRNGKCTDL